MNSEMPTRSEGLVINQMEQERNQRTGTDIQISRHITDMDRKDTDFYKGRNFLY